MRDCMVIYGAFSNSDNIEGRGHDKLDELFTTEEVAKEYAKGRGPMGCSNGNVQEIYVYKDIKSMKRDKADIKRESLIKSAMDKLTEEEKKVLNII